MAPAPGPRESRGPGGAVPKNRQGAVRPRTVNLLVGLTVLSLFLHVAGSIASITALRSAPMLESLRRQYSLQGVPTDLIHNDALRNSLLASTMGNMVLGLMITSLFVVVLFGIMAGSDWGRWGGLVLTAAFLIWNAVQVAPWIPTDKAPGLYGQVSAGISIAFLVVSLLWLAVAFTAPVKQWFRRAPQPS